MPKPQKILTELEEVLGAEATDRLQKTFGGERVYVPSSLDFFHPLTQCLGLEKANELIFHYSGCRLSLPLNREYARQERNHSIVRDRSNGRSINELVRAYQLSFRTIQQILRQYREDVLKD